MNRRMAICVLIHEALYWLRLMTVVLRKGSLVDFRALRAVV